MAQKQRQVIKAHRSWEIKDRTYFLTGTNTPLTLTIPSRHTQDIALLF